MTKDELIALERSVVAACMLRGPEVYDATGGLTAEMFLEPRHAALWRALGDSLGSDRPATTGEVLEALGESAGLFDGLIGVTAYADPPWSPAPSRDARIIRDHWQRRAFRAACLEAAELADGCESLRALASTHEHRVGELLGEEENGRAKPIQDWLQEAGRLVIDEIKGGESSGTPTRIRALDREIGGMRPGQLIVIRAKTGEGKSALGTSIMDNVCIRADEPVSGYVCTLEMTGAENAERILLAHAEVDKSQFRRVTPTPALVGEAIRKLEAARREIHGKARLMIDDAAFATIYDIRARLRRWSRAERRKDPKRPLIGFVDYIQIVNPADTRMQREAQVAEVVRVLKGTAKELEMAILAPCQINDDGKSRESRAIDQWADHIWDVERNNRVDKDGRAHVVEDAQIVIGKQRGGRVGVIPVAFRGGWTRFTDGKVTSRYDESD